MSKRTLRFDWCTLPGARPKKRKLYFEADQDNLFVCPIKSCLHQGYKSKRGVRKHVSSQHPWYFFFDDQPEVKREDAQENLPEKRKATTHQRPGFSIENGFGSDFVQWLQTPCGGGKNLKDSK